MRVAPEEYARLDLRAHSLLADVPLHDVWAADLPGGGPGRTVLDLRALFSGESLRESNAAVRFLFGLRTALGKVFGWDREVPGASRESFVHRLTAEDRATTLVPPGTPQGIFATLFVSPRESIGEIRNPTVHAFSVFVLVGVEGGYRLYWAIYVRPVGRLTSWYMALIDPFRRVFIYPAILRRVREVWDRKIREA